MMGIEERFFKYQDERKRNNRQTGPDSKVKDFIDTYFYKWDAVAEGDRKQFMKERAMECPLETVVCMDKHLDKACIYEWIKEFYALEQHLEEYAKVIQKSTVNKWCLQFLIIIMKYMDEQTLDSVIEQLFSDKFRDDSRAHLSFEKMSEVYGFGLGGAFSSMPQDIYWQEVYFKIIPKIIKAREFDNTLADKLEYCLRGQGIWVNIKDDVLNAYYEVLKKAKSYEGIVYFIERVSYRDKGLELFGKNEEELVGKFFEIPSPHLLRALYLHLYKEDCSHEEEWNNRILKINKDENTCKWVRIFELYRKVWLCTQKGDFSEVEALADSAQRLTLFDLDAVTYMTHLLARMAETVNTLLLNGQDVVSFLKKMEKVNLYSYDKVDYVSTYKGYLDGRDELKGVDYNKIQEQLFAIEDAEDLLYVYMNSYLRLKIDLRNVIEHLKDRDARAIYKLFSKYPIKFGVRDVSAKDALDKRIMVIPLEVYTKWTFQNALDTKKREGGQGPETKSAFNKIIRNDVNWCKNNLRKAELFKQRDVCTGYISGIDEDNFIYVCKLEKKDYAFDIAQREAFPDWVVTWLRGVSEKKELTGWDCQKIRRFYMNHVDHIEKRMVVALEYLKTIYALRDHANVLDAFLRLTQGHYPEETINEFRYISANRFKEFPIADIKEEAKRLGEKIFAAPELTAEQKCMIYKNTCLKAVFKLEEVCDILGETFFSEQFVFPLQIEKILPSGKQLSPKYENSVISSDYDFFYEGKEFIPLFTKMKKGKTELKRKGVYSVFLKGVDHEKRCFYLNCVYRQSGEDWAVFIRLMHDLKRQNLTEGTPHAIKKKMDEMSVFYMNDRSVCQYTYELNEIFRLNQYDKDRCFTVLETLGENNFYTKDAQMMDTFELSEEDKETYCKAYQCFMENNPNGSHRRFCPIFFRSHFRKVISKEQFFEDIQKKGINVDVAKDYCKTNNFL